MKIFGIGLSRTGTTSLTSALHILGIRAVHFPFSHAEIDANDGATDTPVAAGFAYLDAMYPGSKFVLTVRRDLAAWLDSCERLWINHPQIDTLYHKRIHQWLYGGHKFNRERFAWAHTRHLENVFLYFAGRNDLLTMDITAGDGWEKLCPFLGVPGPGVPFPHVSSIV